MALNVPLVASNMAAWVRQAATAINAPRDYPFEHLSDAPANPAPGRTYFDLTLGKVRTFAGGVWHDHF